MVCVRIILYWKGKFRDRRGRCKNVIGECSAMLPYLVPRLNGQEAYALLSIIL